MANVDIDALRKFLEQSAQGGEEPAPTDNVDPAPEPTPEPAPAPTEPAPTSTPLDSVVDNPDQSGVVEPHIAEQMDKDNNAFAEMRVANKQMQDMLSKIADAYGIQYTDSNDMMNKLNDDAITKIAEKKGIPVEFLKRMESLEADANAFRAQQNQQRLAQGFKDIQTEFGCTPEELQAFAAQLDAERVDVRTVNLKSEYVARNFEAIMNKRIEAAVQAALKGDATAAQQSTAPVQPGATSGNTAQSTVNSVGDLRTLLNQLSK